MTLLIISLGFLFGLFLQYSKVNTYNVISGMAILEDYTVAKTIATAIGVGAILLSIEIQLGLADYHIKPFVTGNIILGGLIFGSGMAILGYCPGTMPVSLGQGSLDALFGILGGFVASFVYTLAAPYIDGTLGGDLGKIGLSTLIDHTSVIFLVVTIIIGVVFLGISFMINRIDKHKNLKWLFSGIGISIVAAVIFHLSDRVLGASSFYPYVADNLFGVTANDYYIKQVDKQGLYEMKFLAGAFLSGLIISLLRKEFKLTLVHDNWVRFKGNAKSTRIVWSLTGGFLLLFGARLANGCTSGHIISGGMQLAFSSLTFAVFVFAAFLLTGKIFYRK